MHVTLTFLGGFFIGLVVAIVLHTLKQMQTKSWLPHEEEKQ